MFTADEELKPIKTIVSSSKKNSAHSTHDSFVIRTNASEAIHFCSCTFYLTMKIS